MPLIKASRANLSTSHYSTGGNNSLLAVSDSSGPRKQIFTERNKGKRGKKAPYVGVWVWVPILAGPGKL